jgi:hypothetical protein
MRKTYRDVKDENSAGALASNKEVGLVADRCNCQRFCLSHTFTQVSNPTQSAQHTHDLPEGILLSLLPSLTSLRVCQPTYLQTLVVGTFILILSLCSQCRHVDMSCQCLRPSVKVERRGDDEKMEESQKERRMLKRVGEGGIEPAPFHRRPRPPS